ncbi:hypothetical protein GGR57DRAFT_275689 [Xylariaceae sp. FL1272]|nr:hypothetical protein GGR57DRAFT_275689 [Xylariaceae sp. FL1272]
MSHYEREPPCVQYCQGYTFSNFYQDLALCKSNDKVSGEYCCGENASCCTETSSFFTIPRATSIFKAAGIPTRIPPDSTTTSTTAAADMATSSSPRNQKNQTNNNDLRIGLGVGLGLGLSLLALALAYLAFQIGHRNSYTPHQGDETVSATTQPSRLSHYTPEPKPQELPSPPQELGSDGLHPELPVDLDYHCGR